MIAAAVVALAVQAAPAGPAVQPSPLVNPGGVRQRTVRFGFMGSPPEIAATGGRITLVLEDRSHVRALPVDATTLAVGRPGRVPPEPPMADREDVTLLTAPTADGWVIAKRTMLGRSTDVDFFRTDFGGNVVHVARPGGSTEPVHSPGGGTTWPAGEHVSGIRLSCMEPGEPGGPILLGFLTADPARYKERDGRLGFAFVNPEGHVVKPPVVVGWSIQAGSPVVAARTAGGFLVAEHLAEDTGMATNHGKDSIAILRVAPDGTATLTDTWEVPKKLWSYAAVMQMRWARRGDEGYLVYGGPEGVYAAPVGAAGKREGEPHRFFGPDEGVTGSKLMAAEFLGGKLRAVVDDPIRLLEMIPGDPPRARVLCTFKRDADTWSACFMDGSAYVVWSRVQRPPPYLTRLTPP